MLLTLSPIATLANIATICTALIAGVAAIIAWNAYRAEIASALDVRARDTYQDYLKFCVSHPELSSTQSFEKYIKSNFSNVNKDSIEVERYYWFISVMLNACEQIILFVPDDPSWQDVIEAQISYHLPAIAYNWNDWSGHYSDEMVELIERVLPSHD